MCYPECSAYGEIKSVQIIYLLVGIAIFGCKVIIVNNILYVLGVFVCY